MYITEMGCLFKKVIRDLITHDIIVLSHLRETQRIYAGEAMHHIVVSFVAVSSYHWSHLTETVCTDRYHTLRQFTNTPFIILLCRACISNAAHAYSLRVLFFFTGRVIQS